MSKNRNFSPGEIIMSDDSRLIAAFNNKLEADPDGIKAHEAGAKLDSGKPDASLLLMFAKALLLVAEVGTFGARKYSRGGWQSVANGEERYTAALMRHLLASGYEDNDKDSGLDHDAQVAWNALARLELKLRRDKDG